MKHQYGSPTRTQFVLQMYLGASHINDTLSIVSMLFRTMLQPIVRNPFFDHKVTLTILLCCLNRAAQMNQCIRIGTRSRVEGSHGPLITNPNASIKRQIRSKVIGMVVKAAGPHKWEVIFDYDAKVKTVSSRSVLLISRQM